MTNGAPTLAIQIIAWARRLRPSGRELHRHLRDRGIAVPGWLNEMIPAIDRVPDDGTVLCAITRAMDEAR